MLEQTEKEKCTHFTYLVHQVRLPTLKDSDFSSSAAQSEMRDVRKESPPLWHEGG